MTTINERNKAAYWGFWAKHIFHIRYEPQALQPYKDLCKIIGGKKHFICSTNVDGQLEKAGFNRDKIFAPQGDYALLQCRTACTDEVYDNHAAIDSMLANMRTPLEVRESDIPRCPHCGDFLVPNLRCDGNFVEKPHIANYPNYEDYIIGAENKNLVLLEIGVGFNTPVIIRYPFEQIASQFKNATLVRINREDAFIQKGIENKSISIQADAAQVLKDVLGC